MKFLILSFLSIVFHMSVLLGQPVSFKYDANGNRISRILTVEQLSSESKSITDMNPEFLKLPSKNNSDEEESLKAVESISEYETIETQVYPNPNRGIIYINIINMPLNSKNEVRVYDLAGIEQYINKNLESNSEINISNLKDGTYILLIKVNQKLFNWKIIKTTY